MGTLEQLLELTVIAEMGDSDLFTTCELAKLQT